MSKIYTPEEELRKLLIDLWKVGEIPNKYSKYIKDELDNINKHNVAQYYIDAYNAICFCKSKSIYIVKQSEETTRSIILYFLGVNHINPVDNDVFNSKPWSDGLPDFIIYISNKDRNIFSEANEIFHFVDNYNVLRDSYKLSKHTICHGTEDPKAYSFLRSGKFNYVPEFSSNEYIEFIKKMKPDCFEDIITIVALIGFNPLSHKILLEYIGRKHKKKKVFYSHDIVKEITKKTFGLIIYQEQAIEILCKVSGIREEEFNFLKWSTIRDNRYGRFKEKFIELGSDKYGIEFSEKIFNACALVISNGLVKSSIISKAIRLYSFALIKRNHKDCFYCAVLNNNIDKNRTDKIIIDASKNKVEFSNGNINNIEEKCHIGRKGTIVLGLLFINGIDKNVSREVVRARNGGNKRIISNKVFSDYDDFIKKTNCLIINDEVKIILNKYKMFDIFKEIKDI